MNKIILKNKESAKARGYGGNYEFVTDKNISPYGIDIMPVSSIEWQKKKPDKKKCPDKYWKWFMSQQFEVTHLVDGEVAHLYNTTRKEHYNLIKTL